ncbi:MULTISPECIES: protocatechuate 3,4-dioxygenase subunit beta [Actinosynnema]|uniref:protocatechuate 3,4-dioxygenase subunit beta n=1 Tax=Actinosynnema TaxID=40566 RepID=UPI0020A55935|nr:protocatechuate 3,4-dioxygenase subunit beta [Actinosynnema pretiosum]MCP2098631.1 protocatechuate 3,4-dioxygenase, beta subunit [Actinosynnema pretiosum]
MPSTTIPEYRRDHGSQPPVDFPAYRSNALRAPRRPLVLLPQRLTEVTGPLLGADRVGEHDHDLTAGHPGEPIGQRITLSGRVLDGGGRPVAGALVEVWQANAAGRYRHDADRHPAPLDPNFTGVGRCVTDPTGAYSFTTVRPGAYPWRNHDNAWRPAHVHFSLFGSAFTQRLITQVYFPGDPLLPLDPVFNSVRDEAARASLVAAFDLGRTVPERSLGYRWDIVLRGKDPTPLGDDDD